MKSLLKLAFWVVLAILVYNYFAGTASEKKTSQKIFGEVKNLAVSVKDLISSETEKYNNGKYDVAISKMDDIIGKLKHSASENADLLHKVNDLEQRKENLSKELEINKSKDNTVTKNPALKQDFKDLLKDAENLMQEMDK